MTATLPADLSLPGGRPIEAARWCVTWPADDAGHWREAYFSDQAGADAWCASHRGAVRIRLAALDPWPAGFRRAR